jgi:hypothetical protein
MRIAPGKRSATRGAQPSERLASWRDAVNLPCALPGSPATGLRRWGGRAQGRNHARASLPRAFSPTAGGYTSFQGAR